MACSLEDFKYFESGKYVCYEDLKHMCNYICSNLNNWTPNYRFWYNMYSYSSKAYIVCRWRESKGLSPVAKWGEAICKNELVHFLMIPNIKAALVEVFIIKKIFNWCLFI